MQVTTSEQQLEADQKALATAKQQLAASRARLSAVVELSAASSSASSSPRAAGVEWHFVRPPSSSGSSQSSRFAVELIRRLRRRALDGARLERRRLLGELHGGLPDPPRPEPLLGVSLVGSASVGTGSSRSASGRSPGSSGAGSVDGDGQLVARNSGPGPSGTGSRTRRAEAAAATNTTGLTNGRAIVYAALVAPTVTTGQASGVTAGSARVAQCQSRPGLATTYSFQYGTSPSTLSLSTPSQSAAIRLRRRSGHGSARRPELPRQSYWFRLVATNSPGHDRRVARTLHDHEPRATGPAVAAASTTGTTDGGLGLCMTTDAAPVTPGPSATADDGTGVSVTSTGATSTRHVTTSSHGHGTPSSTFVFDARSAAAG